MSYYLGLIGLGLFFVLCIHVYNRWIIYNFRKHEKSQLFGFKGDNHSTSSVNNTSIFVAGDATIKTKHKKSYHSPEQDDEVNNSSVNKSSSQKIFENVTLSNLDRTPPEVINKWIGTTIFKPFLNSIKANAKNGDKLTLWDCLSPKKINKITQPITNLKYQFKLACRSGCFDISNIRYVRSKLQQITEISQAKLEMAEESEIATRSEALDEISAEFDVQIVVTLLCRNQAGVSGGQISKEAINNDMIFDNGSFHKVTANGESQYSMSFHVPDTTIKSLEELETLIGHKATLTLDVPRTKDGQLMFKQMSKFAQHLTAIINADLVDDRLQNLSTVSLDTISQQIEQLQKRMIQLGFEPGSPAVNRLFS